MSQYLGYLSRGWVAIGPLVGVLIGAYLSRSWDRKKWISENRKNECRELLETLTKSCTMFIEEAQIPLVAIAGVDELATRNQYLHTLRTLQDRIFIAEDIARMHLFDLVGRIN